MSIYISSVSVPFREGEDAAIAQALRRIRLSPGKARAYIVKSSVDARRRSDIRLVYTVGVDCDGEEAIVRRAGDPAVRLHRPQRPSFVPGTAPLAARRWWSALARRGCSPR